MKLLNSKILLAIIITAFAWLFWHSYHYSYLDGVYSQSDIEAVNQLVAKSEEKADSFKHRQAAALKDVWFLSEREIGQPVRLWGVK